MILPASSEPSSFQKKEKAFRSGPKRDWRQSPPRFSVLNSPTFPLCRHLRLIWRPSSGFCSWGFQDLSLPSMIWVIQLWEIRWQSCISSRTTFCFKSVLKMQFQLSELLSTLQGGKDWSVSRIPGEKGFLASCLYLINCPFSLQCFKRETLLLSEGDFQLGWASGSGYVMGVLDGEERFRAEDATMPSVPSQVMTDTSYFHGLYSQIIHFCCCVLGFITKVKTVQIRLWKGSAVLNLLIKCTCFWRNSHYIRCPSSFWNTWWENWPMCFEKEAFTFLYLGNFLSFG